MIGPNHGEPFLKLSKMWPSNTIKEIVENPILSQLNRGLTRLADRPNLNPNSLDTDLLSPNRNVTELPVLNQLDIGTLDRGLLDKCKDPSTHGLIRHKTVAVLTTVSLAK